MRRMLFVFVGLIILGVLDQSLPAWSATGDLLYTIPRTDFTVVAYNPSGMSIDGDGNLYVAQALNYTGVKVYDNDGYFLKEFKDWNFYNYFDYPADVALSTDGSVMYVANTNDHNVRIFSTNGYYLKTIGGCCNGGTIDGEFRYPYGIAVNASDNVYVADTSNNRIQVFDPDGNFLWKFGTYGNGDGDLSSPTDVAFDASGNVYVVDTGNHRIQVFDSAGNFLWKFGTVGYGDGEFIWPRRIAIDEFGYLYVVDTHNYRVQIFDSSGNFVRKFGKYGDGDGEFVFPFGIAVDVSGNIFVSDRTTHRIEIFDNEGNYLKTVRRAPGIPLQRPYDVAVDSFGKTYVADYYLSTVTVYDSAGNYVRLLGGLGSLDGHFRNPSGVAVDDYGNVYVADTNNHRIQIFDKDGNLLNKFGTYGSDSNQFNSPNDVAVDANGYIYVADTENRRICKYSNSGNLVWTMSFYSRRPYGIHVDIDGYIYWVDADYSSIYVFNSEKQYVRGLSGFGAGGFKFPRGITTDASGNFYVADTGNHRILLFDSQWRYKSELKGEDKGGFFSKPFSVTVDEVGNIYVANTYGSRVQVYKGDADPPIVTGLIAAPNPVAINIPVTVAATLDDSSTGSSKISSAECTLSSSPDDTIQMTASDGEFNTMTENVTCSLPPFSEAGIQEICVQGDDENGNTSELQCTLLVVYDPDGSFVTGGGWIDSPEGAYVPSPSLTGKANFGFVSKYKKGATEPTGKTEFQFHVADLNFHSETYQWLVVNHNGTNAQFKGYGTINGEGNYGFMLWAGDESHDTFRIRIWLEDEFANESDIYDNGSDQEIGGGSIMIR